MKDKNRHISKDVQVANKRTKRYALLDVTEMQIKTTMRNHFTSPRMARIKKAISIERMRKIGALINSGGNAKWCSPIEEFGNSSKCSTSS